MYTPTQNFLILEEEPLWIGTEDDNPEIDADLDVYYYPRPGLLDVRGGYVYKLFPKPMDIYIMVEGENNEKS